MHCSTKVVDAFPAESDGVGQNPMMKIPVEDDITIQYSVEQH